MSHSGRNLATRHSTLAVVGLGLTLAAVFLAPVAFLVTPVGLTDVFATLPDWRFGSVLIYIGLFPTALAYVCYCCGMVRCRSAVAGLVASIIEPSVAAGLAFLFLREVLSPWEVMGCVLLFFVLLTLWLDDQPDEMINPTKMKVLRQVVPILCHYESPSSCRAIT